MGSTSSQLGMMEDSHQVQPANSASLQEVVSFCDSLLDLPGFPDYPGACNGLQAENNGRITRIGASVDAGLPDLERAVEAGVDFLIVHHGLFWNPERRWTGIRRRQMELVFRENLAIYSAHLPLDAHPVLGNNALLLHDLGLVKAGNFAAYEGCPIGLFAEYHESRAKLYDRLVSLFPKGIQAFEFGSDRPSRVGVLSGSGASALVELTSLGIDTLITGEASQHHYNQASELGINMYLCGHYATETAGVCALASKLAETYRLPHVFLESACPL